MMTAGQKVREMRWTGRAVGPSVYVQTFRTSAASDASNLPQPLLSQILLTRLHTLHLVSQHGFIHLQCTRNDGIH